MRWTEITESPIGDIYTHGDFFKSGSIRQDDLSLATKKRQDKIKRVLEKAPVLIDLHFVNLPEMIDIQKHVGPTLYSQVNNIGFLSKEQIKQKYNVDIDIVPNAINLVYVQNEGTDRIPLTPWIIAHRLGHVFYYPEETKFEIRDLLDLFQKILTDVADLYSDEGVEPRWEMLAPTFGTTRACREGMIRETRVAEWFYDCFAQMCVIGDIKFNKAPYKIPYPPYEFFIKEKMNSDIINRYFEIIRKKMILEFNKMLHQAVGKILVF